MNFLLRHGQSPREDDGAIEFWRIKDYLRNDFENSQYWSDEMWKSKNARRRGNKKRFQYCTDSSGQEILYLRALQGHSGRNPIDPTLQDNVFIPDNIFEYIYHIGCAVNVHVITSSGLIPGGQNSSRERQTAFFKAVNPMDKEHKDPHKFDLTKQRLASYKQKKWKRHQDTVHWVDIQLAQRKGLKFYQTRSNAIILCDTLPAYCIPKAIMMETGEIIYKKVYVSSRPSPTKSFKDNWVKELDSEVAGSSKDTQRIQPEPTTQLSRTGRPVGGQQSTQVEEIDIDFRVPGLSLAIVKEAEKFQVQEVVKNIESHPHGEALQADLQQSNVYNHLASHFCSNFFLLARKKSHFRWFLLHLRQPSYGTQRMEFSSSSRGVGSSGPRATPQVGPVASCFEGRETPITTCARDDPKAGPLAPHLNGQEACTPIPAFKPNRAPEVVVADAVADVQRLEAAIAVLGGDNVHAKGLQEALRVARSKTKVLPISERVEACKLFVERAKKWSSERAQEVMDKAHAWRIVHEEEVAEGERRLALLQAEVATPGPDPNVQVTQLQQQIDSLVRERDALRANAVAATVPQDKPVQWMGNGPPSVENVPPMPTDLQDLEGWLSDRNCELRNAMEFRNPGLVGQIGPLIGQGARQLEISRDQSNVPMNGQGRSSMMAALIDQADSKRRCIEATQLDGSQV